MARTLDIGGGYVRRRFQGQGDSWHVPGEHLTAAQINAIPLANRNALIALGKLETYPRAPLGDGSSSAEVKRYPVHMGMGKFDVIEGRKLNDAPLTRVEADALCPPDQRTKGRRTKAKRAN